MSWFRHALYLGVVLAAQPFAIAEAAAGKGATIMIEAEKIGLRLTDPAGKRTPLLS